MKTLFAVTIVTIYGLFVRTVFGFMSDIVGVMSMSFLVLLPVILGYFTVALILRKKSIGGISSFFWPWVTNFVLLVITILLNIEGAICWIMIYPMVSVLSGIGGVVAYYTISAKSNRKKENKVNMPDILDSGSDTLKISVLFVLPMFVGLIEGDHTLTSKEINLKREVIIPASSKKVWNALINLNQINPEERTFSYLYGLVNFPGHIRTTIDTVAVGGNRIAYYENNLYFKETITRCEPEKLLVLDIDVDPAKVPPAVMDEHIVIGGKYVDILEDTYTMEKMADGQCKLSLNSRFVIRTPFNWYTALWAEALMSDILQGELNIVKKRVAENN